jgi:lipopolysaccharide export system ATP-binding protein
MHKLKGQNLVKSFKSTPILRHVNLEAQSGQVVGLLGPNGAGKTTTFYIMCGLIAATSGEVVLDGVDISHLSLSARAALGIGYLPQESSVFKELTVEDNLLMAAELVMSDEEQMGKRVDELLNLLDIEPIRYRKGVSLSGGERRRVEIARALVNEPKFIFLDEPFAGVDPLAVGDIQHLIETLKSHNIGVVITDHNFRETLAICDFVYVLKEGEILASGTSEDIYNNPLVKQYYLGDIA